MVCPVGLALNQLESPRDRLLQNVPSQPGIGSDGTFALPHVSVMDNGTSVVHPPVVTVTDHDEKVFVPNATVQGIGSAETAESVVPPRVLCPGTCSGREAKKSIATVRIQAPGVTLSPAEHFKPNTADDGLQSEGESKKDSVSRELQNKKHARVKYTVRGK